MPGLVKIGMTTRSDIEQRMRELYSTGVPVPFDCAYACEVKASDCLKIERALHQAFAPNRINNNREFFRLDPEQVSVILALVDRKNITEEVSAEIQQDLTEEDKQSSEKIKRVSRPALNYQEMGIPVGATLSYTKDPSIQVTVISGRKVSYQDEERFLTPITQELLGAPRAVQPTPYWEYEGKNLMDIYDQTYPFSE